MENLGEFGNFRGEKIEMELKQSGFGNFWERKNLRILAPMVRVGRLPFRLLSEECGADIVFTEELIDRKLLRCERKINEKLNVVEYLNQKTNRLEVVYQFQKRKIPTVLQIGTADSVHALQTGKMMFQDYDGLDINMGCPKGFSTRGKMGVALLRDSQRVNDILTTLVRNIPSEKPISCKIRIFKDDKRTLDLLKLIDNTGVKNITIHARYPDERPRKEPAHPDKIKLLTHGLKTPVVYNGDVFTPADIPKMRALTGCGSVMLARGAMYNCSLFSDEKWDVNVDGLVLRLLELSELYHEDKRRAFLNSQYIIKRMHEVKKGKIYKRIVQVKNMEELKSLFLKDRMEDLEPPKKRQKVDHE